MGVPHELPPGSPLSSWDRIMGSGIVGFREDLAAAKAHVSDRVKTPVIECVVNKHLYELVFYRAEPEEWSKFALENPPREGVGIDQRNGYSISGMARAVSPSCGRLIEDGVELELTVEEWVDLWAVLPPSTARLVEANVWSLHEHDTEQEIARAKKASQRRSRKKSN